MSDLVGDHKVFISSFEGGNSERKSGPIFASENTAFNFLDTLLNMEKYNQ